MATPELIEQFVNNTFDALLQKLSTDEFAEFFEIETLEHSDFKEVTSTDFILNVMSREDRIDNFVTAEITRPRGQSVSKS
jgi:hypothetical protein